MKDAQHILHSATSPREVIALGTELLALVVIIVIFVVGSFAVKLPIGLAMVAAAMGGTLVSGFGIPLRHLVEGGFGYIDTILVIATAMIFMKVIQQSGTLDFISREIIIRYYKKPALLLMLLMLLAMFPGMITGSSTAAVLSTGAIVAVVLINLGIPKVETAAIIAMGGLLGMIAPPVNVPVMIIGGGVDMPYVGFTLPLLLMTLPVAFFTVLFLGLKHCRDLDIEAIMGRLPEVPQVSGFLLLSPLLVVGILMVATQALPGIVPALGMPLIFILGIITAIFTSKGVRPFEACTSAIKDALPVMGILVGIGMIIQVMTLTGVRGLIVISALSLPSVLLYLGIATSIPLFGTISAYGSASVLGVPFLLALLGGNEIIVGAALSLIASIGDLMPPTALAGIFAAQVVGIDNYFVVLRKCIIPALVIILIGIFFVIYSKHFGFLVL